MTPTWPQLRTPDPQFCYKNQWFFKRFCFPYFFAHLLLLRTLGTSSWSILDLLGVPLGCLGRLLGVPWGSLGALLGSSWDIWAPLWGILDHLGLTLGSSWVHLAPLWLLWYHFGSSRVHFGTLLAPSGTLWGQFWDHVGTIFGYILIACEPSTLDPQSWSRARKHEAFFEFGVTSLLRTSLCSTPPAP